jgi:hypothetical protein
MSFVSANDHPDPVSPLDPLYYAPRSARGGVTESRPSAPQLAPSGNLPSDPRTSRFDEMREEAFAKFARPLESQFVDERRRSRGLLATVGAVAVAVGATATLAYVALNASPKSKNEPAELAVSISTPALTTPALATPTQAAPPSADSQALLEGFKQFQRTQGSEEAAEPGPFSAAAAREKETTKESQVLLDKFMHWQPRK